MLACTCVLKTFHCPELVCDGTTGGPPSAQALDCKANLGRLVMPQVEAVTHGDVNLALDDFMTHATE